MTTHPAHDVEADAYAIADAAYRAADAIYMADRCSGTANARVAAYVAANERYRAALAATTGHNTTKGTR